MYVVSLCLNGDDSGVVRDPSDDAPRLRHLSSHNVCVIVCVCVRARARERDRERARA